MLFCYVIVFVVVECGGVMEMYIVELNGKNLIVDLKVGDLWGLNVYVLVFVLCGWICEVLWYLFFMWGWKVLVEWVCVFWCEGCYYEVLIVFVDLLKFVFCYGFGEIKVGMGVYCFGVIVMIDVMCYMVCGKV